MSTSGEFRRASSAVHIEDKAVRRRAKERGKFEPEPRADGKLHATTVQKGRGGRRCRWIDTGRRHSALGQISPLQFEAQHTNAVKAA